MRRSRLVSVVAVGFALGSLEHAVGLGLLAFGIEMYAGYPAWRHAAFAVVDGLIAFLACRRPERLFVPLLSFLIEQVAINGALAWRTWRATGAALWPVIAMQVLIAAATVIAARERRRHRATVVLRSQAIV